jgi:hypothetical protein
MAVMNLAALALFAFIVILVALVVFQVALIAGAPLGRFAWGGQHERLPRKLRIGSVVSVVLYVAFIVLALDRVGAIDVLPDAFSVIAMWVLTGYLALGVILNLISRSKPERYLMTPVALVLALLAWVIAAS